MLFLSILWSNKTIVFTILITLFLSYAVFMLFKRADVANTDAELSNRDRKALQQNIVKLGQEKDSLLLINKSLWARIKTDSIAVSYLKKSIANKKVVVTRQQTDIKTIKDKYETVYRLDSMSDDQLMRLFSKYNIETSPHKK